MCGIAGLARPGGLRHGAQSAAEAMTRSLAHRGPDEERVTPIGGASPWAVTGARRLAILDPERGQQPVADASGRFVVAMNGEIYNHRRLRQEMHANGVPFHSEGDTEVVANLVALCGVERALEQLRGMFALAIVDTHHHAVTLARDRMGQKPLYWSLLADGTLAWGSELRAVRRAPGAPDRPSRQALQAMLLWEYIPAPWTAWEGIQKLEPGHLLRFTGAAPTPAAFWTPPVPQRGSAGSHTRWARSLRGALEVAVAQRLEEADVEVGVLLSGGLDSTAVTALAQARRSRPLRSFSVSVRAAGFDEGAWARQAAAAIGTEHREIALESGDLPRILARISQFVDEPLADSSLVPTWRLMEAIQEAGLKCVLSGDGADESFGGYPTLQAHRLAALATPGRRGLQRIVSRLPTRHDGVTRDYMARRFVDGLGLPWARRHQVWMGAWLPDELDLSPTELSSIWGVVDAHSAACADTDLASRALYLDQRLFLADGVLVKVDRASMAHGVEVRSPFLDHLLVELAAQIPIAMKVRGTEGKRILKDAVADVVPSAIRRRKKKGFGAPVGPWLRGPCAHLLADLPSQLDDLIDPDRMRRVLDEHARGAADHRRRLWSALVLAGWRRHHA